MDIAITEGIVKQFENALDNHNYPFTRSAVRKIVSTSLARKNQLYELFKKHPKWDEQQLCIHFDHDFERKVDISAQGAFIRYLYDQCYKSLEEGERINQVVIWKDENIGWAEQTLYEAIAQLPYAITLPEFKNEKNLWGCAEEREIDYRKALERINAVNPKWNFRPGMKTSRVINKICQHFGYDKLPGYDRRFAEYSDAVTPLKVNRHTTISINPVDFLMMSNGNSWHSCHWIGCDPDDAGCYSSGTVSYMMGEDSFIVSIIDKEANGDNLACEPKIMRQVFGYNDYQILQSRLYPQNCDSGAEHIYANIRAMVEEIIADALGEPNRWVKTEQNVSSNGTAYQDWLYNSLCKQWVLRGHEEDDKDSIYMSDEPICVKCGDTHDYEECIICEDCKPHCCADCGCEIDLNDTDSYVEYDGDYYCTDCRFVCERCGEIERQRYATWISDIEETWCSYCADRYATRCECCGDAISQAYATDKDGNDICESCYDNDYVTCAKCGELISKDAAEEIEGQLYCADCADEVRADMEEEGESA